MSFLSKFFPVSVPLPRPPVSEGVTRICVSGFGFSHHTGRARAIASAIAETYPEKYETWYYFDTRGFRPAFLDAIKTEITESSESGMGAVAEHKQSPFCWLEGSSSSSSDDSSSSKTMTPIGGRDRLVEWAKTTFDEKDEKNEAILSLCRTEPTLRDLKFDASTPGTAKAEAAPAPAAATTE